MNAYAVKWQRESGWKYQNAYKARKLAEGMAKSD